MSTTAEPGATGHACPECNLRFPSSRRRQRHVVADHRPAPDGAVLIEALLNAPSRSQADPAAPDVVAGTPPGTAAGAAPGAAPPAAPGAAPPAGTARPVPTRRSGPGPSSPVLPSASALLRWSATLLLLGWILHRSGISWSTLLSAAAALALLIGTAVLLFWLHTDAGRAPHRPPTDRF